MFKFAAVMGLAAVMIAGCGSTGRSLNDAESTEGEWAINFAEFGDESFRVDDRAIRSFYASRPNMGDGWDWSYNPELRRMGLYVAPDGNLYTLPTPRVESFRMSRRLPDGTWEDVPSSQYAPEPPASPPQASRRVSWAEFEAMFRR